MKLVNETRGSLLSENCTRADKFFTRFKGLMFRASLPKGTGLLLEPCNSIHMLFMKFPIDAIFIDRDGKVLLVLDSLKPWRLSPIVKGAKTVAELPAGTAKATGTQEGDVIKIKG